MQQQSSHHPYSSVLRHRAGSLRALASSIERLLVNALGDQSHDDAWTGARAELCERMLAHNLHQLHLAADDLRETAIRLCRRADELDVSARSVA